MYTSLRRIAAISRDTMMITTLAAFILVQAPFASFTHAATDSQADVNAEVQKTVKHAKANLSDVNKNQSPDPKGCDKKAKKDEGCSSKTKTAKADEKKCNDKDSAHKSGEKMTEKSKEAKCSMCETTPCKCS